MIEIQKITRDYYEQSYTNNLDNLEETDKFLEIYNLPRMNYEETENLNRPIISKEMASLVNCTKHLKN